MKEYTLKFWRDIKSKTPNFEAYERGGQVLSKTGFSAWKLQCQVVTSRECKKPEKAPNTYRSQCPGCHKHHHNFTPCLKKLKCYRKNCINNRKSALVLAIKKLRRADLLDAMVEVFTEVEEWIYIPKMIQIKGQQRRDT